MAARATAVVVTTDMLYSMADLKQAHVKINSLQDATLTLPAETGFIQSEL